ADLSLHVPEGYAVPGTRSGAEKISADGGDVVNVVYSKRTDLSYVIHYYKDEIVEDEEHYLGSSEEIKDKTFGEGVTLGDTRLNKEKPIGYNNGVQTPAGPYIIKVKDNVIDVLYTKKTNLSYTVNYYKDSKAEGNLIKNVEGKGTFDDYIEADLRLFAPPGYIIPGERSGAERISANGGDVVDVVYSKDHFGYSVHYFYDEVEDEQAVERGNEEFGSLVSTYKEKTNGRYVLDYVENLPLTIGTDVSTNIINVYYTLDEIGTEDPTKPDGVPDKYQEIVVFGAVNGTVGGTTQVEKVVTLEKEGKPSEDGVYTLTENDIPEALAAAGYDQKTKSWDAEPKGAVIDKKEETKVTFIVSFAEAAQTYMVQYIDEDTKEGLRAQEVKDAKYGDYITGADEAVKIDGYAFTRATDLRVSEHNESNYVFVYYSKDEKGNGPDGNEPDGIPDKYETIFVYKSADVTKGTVDADPLKAEVHVFMDADGNYTEKTPVSPNGANATALDGFAFDYWNDSEGNDYTPDMSKMKSNTYLVDTTFTAYFDVDEIGTEEPNAPDGVPDKYQIMFQYVSEDTNHGTVSGAVTEVKTIYEIVTGEEGYDHRELSPARPDANVTVSNLGRYSFNNWTDGSRSYANADEIKAAEFTQSTTFTAQFNYNSGGGPSGGGGGGGTGSDPTGNGRYNPSPGGPGSTTITPEDVPLAPLPELPVDVTLIDDGEVPLAPLPKTGQTSMRTTLTMMLSGIFVAVTALSKKRKEEDS
ncbi:MAG: doubled motif LPXTG anchor domain-containing protein, partial [Clostridia bacterium]|nr:doubled motif LPXTG anchor domain-containing protein [Clostridia bacterium]